ncbi:unnamed protein product [marine sediment metagenome]|uniref:Uncharacterized protein n=1 Tax=marine sediment metagenome TaxID=412755 RepID=X1TDF5_9ZZZZ
MPLLKIQSYPGFRQVFIASDTISDLATVELVVGPGRRVAMGSTANQHLAAGVARGAVVSGALVRVVTHGIVSGVKTDRDINAGDRLAIATSGMVTPLNTIQPTAVSGDIRGLVSGLTVSGWLASGDWTASGLVLSGYAAIIASGQLIGAAFNTGRIVGKALTSGESGLGIQMLVSPG